MPIRKESALFGPGPQNYSPPPEQGDRVSETNPHAKEPILTRSVSAPTLAPAPRSNQLGQQPVMLEQQAIERQGPKTSFRIISCEDCPNKVIPTPSPKHEEGGVLWVENDLENLGHTHDEQAACSDISEIEDGQRPVSAQEMIKAIVTAFIDCDQLENYLYKLREDFSSDKFPESAARILPTEPGEIRRVMSELKSIFDPIIKGLPEIKEQVQLVMDVVNQSRGRGRYEYIPNLEQQSSESNLSQLLLLATINEFCMSSESWNSLEKQEKDSIVQIVLGTQHKKGYAVVLLLCLDISLGLCYGALSCPNAASVLNNHKVPGDVGDWLALGSGGVIFALYVFFSNMFRNTCRQKKFQYQLGVLRVLDAVPILLASIVALSGVFATYFQAGGYEEISLPDHYRIVNVIMLIDSFEIGKNLHFAAVTISSIRMNLPCLIKLFEKTTQCGNNCKSALPDLSFRSFAEAAPVLLCPPFAYSYFMQSQHGLSDADSNVAPLISDFLSSCSAIANVTIPYVWFFSAMALYAEKQNGQERVKTNCDIIRNVFSGISIAILSCLAVLPFAYGNAGALPKNKVGEALNVVTTLTRWCGLLLACYKLKAKVMKALPSINSKLSCNSFLFRSPGLSRREAALSDPLISLDE